MTASAVPWKINKSFTVFASIHYSIMLDSAMRDRAKEGTNLWLGIGASFAF